MKFQLILLLSIAALLNIVHAQANADKCNVCLPNYVKCLTPTTYQVCINGAGFGDVQPCKEGTFCSDHKEVCKPADEAGATFVCGTENDDGRCGTCSNDDIFTCVDKTHFVLCGVPDVYVACNAGEICVKELYAISNKICAKESSIIEIGLTQSCSNDETSTTSGESTTPELTTLATACENNIPDDSAIFFYVANESDLSTCRTYIYCEPNDNAPNGNETIADKWTAAYLTCPANKYYDDKAQGCVNTKVDDCNWKKKSNETTP